LIVLGIEILEIVLEVVSLEDVEPSAQRISFVAMSIVGVEGLGSCTPELMVLKMPVPLIDLSVDEGKRSLNDGELANQTLNVSRIVVGSDIVGDVGLGDI